MTEITDWRMFRLKSHDDEDQDDISNLLKKNPGAQTPEDAPAVPTSSPPEKNQDQENPGGTGDFSALLQKLGMNLTGNAPKGAPNNIEVPDPASAGDADDFDDLLEDMPLPEPISRPPA